MAPYSDGSRLAGQILGRGAENGNRGASGRGRVSEGNPGYWRAYPCFRWPRNALVKSGALLPTSLRRWAQARYRRGLTTRASPAAVQSLGAPPPKKAKAVPVPAPRLAPRRRGGGDSPLRARLDAMEMELEALKRGSDGGASQVGGWLKRGHH